MTAGALKIGEPVLPQVLRAHAIQQQAHADAPPGGVGQEFQEPPARLVIPPDVEFQVDVVDRRPDAVDQVADHRRLELAVASSVLPAGTADREARAEKRLRRLRRRRLSRSVPNRA